MHYCNYYYCRRTYTNTERAIGLITVSDATLPGTYAKRSEITVLVWETDIDNKQLFQKLNFAEFVNRKVKVQVRSLCSPSLRDVAWLEDTQLTFLIKFHSFVCKYGWVDAVRGKTKL